MKKRALNTSETTRGIVCRVLNDENVEGELNYSTK
jgi:hypothetical protein